MSKRSYAIIGTGAVGGFYGGRLARAGLDVHFLLRSDYEHVRANGLRVDSPEGDFHLATVNAYHRPENLPDVDVVLVAIKTTQNHLLGELLAPFAGRESVVVMFQNGLGVEQQAAAVVGPDRVMGGLCFLCSNKVGPGHIRHLDYGFVTLGEHAPGGGARGITDRMRAVGADLESAGIKIQLAEDLLGARWKKLVWNVPFNGLSVVLDATIDEIMADGDTLALAEELMHEVTAGARACGRQIGDDFIEYMLALTREMKPYLTSMKIDCQRKRPMEVEAIFGEPLRAAREGGAECPRIGTVYRQLKFIDARNRAGA